MYINILKIISNIRRKLQQLTFYIRIFKQFFRPSFICISIDNIAILNITLTVYES